MAWVIDWISITTELEGASLDTLPAAVDVNYKVYDSVDNSLFKHGRVQVNTTGANTQDQFATTVNQAVKDEEGIV